MPVFENRAVFEIARKVKAFLYLEAGVTRNGKPSSKPDPAMKRDLEEARNQIARQERQIKRLQRRLSNKKPVESQRRSPDTDAPEAGTPIFFVVGQGRSGTGWLKNMLNFHPEVLCKGEGRFFGRDKRNEKLVDAEVGSKASRKKIVPGSLYNAIAESEYLRLWVERSVWSREDDLEEHLNNLTRLAVDYFLTSRLSKTRKKLVGDKTPFFGPEDVKEIATVHPSARVIHIIRDGRDLAVSRMHHFWSRSADQGGRYELMPAEIAKRDAFYQDQGAFLNSGEGIFLEKRLRRIVANWRDDVSSATHYGRDLLGDNYAEVKYEDLLERPEGEARRLFEFLGADTSEKVVKRCVESASFEARAGREQGTEDFTPGRTKHRKGIAGDWNNAFTERDKEIFKEEAGDLLVELGYEKDRDW